MSFYKNSGGLFGSPSDFYKNPGERGRKNPAGEVSPHCITIQYPTHVRDQWADGCCGGLE